MHEIKMSLRSAYLVELLWCFLSTKETLPAIFQQWNFVAFQERELYDIMEMSTLTDGYKQEWKGLMIVSCFSFVYKLYICARNTFHTSANNFVFIQFRIQASNTFRFLNAFRRNERNSKSVWKDRHYVWREQIMHSEYALYPAVTRTAEYLMSSSDLNE
jgi:hypothetical protein